MLIWEKFKKNIIDNKLVVSGDKILLAVSGGADSMVMASLFFMLTKILNIELVVVNFNHNLRKESVKEAKIVERYISSLNIECVLKNLNAKVDTNIAEFHDKLQKEMPNIGAIYLLNDDKNLEAVKQKGCFYLTKPFEIENVISLINKILGK